jgi:hypothetical protein
MPNTETARDRLHRSFRDALRLQAALANPTAIRLVARALRQVVATPQSFGRLGGAR